MCVCWVCAWLLRVTDDQYVLCRGVCGDETRERCAAVRAGGSRWPMSRPRAGRRARDGVSVGRVKRRETMEVACMESGEQRAHGSERVAARARAGRVSRVETESGESCTVDEAVCVSSGGVDCG